MKNLQQIKDECLGSKFKNQGFISVRLSDEIAKRYAHECCKATLEKAAEEVDYDIDGQEHIEAVYIDKESITNEENIVIL